MTDTSSVNFNNPPVDFPPNTPKSTGDRVAGGLIQGIEHLKTMEEGGADLHDRSEGQMLASAGNSTVDQQHPVISSPVSSQIPREAVGISSPELAPDQISKFANGVQIPQAWTEIRREIFPLHEKYLSERNRLADSVMGNKLSTLAALVVTPPLGLVALMKHKSSGKALQQISEKQVNFLVKAINGDKSNPSGNLKQVLINTAQSLDLLNGLSLDKALQSAGSESPAAPALKLAIGLLTVVRQTDATDQLHEYSHNTNVTASPLFKLSVATTQSETITGTNIAAMKELLDESIALLNRPFEEIKTKINSGSGITALKVFVGAMTDVPAYIEEKYNKGRDPLVELGVSQKQSDEFTGFVGKIVAGVKDLVATGANQAAEIVNENTSTAQDKTRKGLLALANEISASPEARQLVKNTSTLTEVAPSLMQQIAQGAGRALEEQLRSSPADHPLFRRLNPEQLDRAYNNIVDFKPVKNKANSN